MVLPFPFIARLSLFMQVHNLTLFDKKAQRDFILSRLFMLINAYHIAFAQITR